MLTCIVISFVFGLLAGWHIPQPAWVKSVKEEVREEIAEVVEEVKAKVSRKKKV
jgi:hypothetical protein